MDFMKRLSIPPVYTTNPLLGGWYPHLQRSKVRLHPTQVTRVNIAKNKTYDSDVIDSFQVPELLHSPPFAENNCQSYSRSLMQTIRATMRSPVAHCPTVCSHENIIIEMPSHISLCPHYNKCDYLLLKCPL